MGKKGYELSPTLQLLRDPKGKSAHQISRIIAKWQIRNIKSRRINRPTEEFMKDLRLDIKSLGWHNNEEFRKTGKYPRSKFLFKLLQQYVALEYQYMSENHLSINDTIHYVLDLLKTFLNDYFGSRTGHTKYFLLYILNSSQRRFNLPQKYCRTLISKLRDDMYFDKSMIRKLENLRKRKQVMLIDEVYFNPSYQDAVSMDDYGTESESDSDELSSENTLWATHNRRICSDSTFNNSRLKKRQTKKSHDVKHIVPKPEIVDLLSDDEDDVICLGSELNADNLLNIQPCKLNARREEQRKKQKHAVNTCDNTKIFEMKPRVPSNFFEPSNNDSWRNTNKLLITSIVSGGIGTVNKYQEENMITKKNEEVSNSKLNSADGTDNKYQEENLRTKKNKEMSNSKLNGPVLSTEKLPVMSGDERIIVRTKGERKAYSRQRSRSNSSDIDSDNQNNHQKITKTLLESNSENSAQEIVQQLREALKLLATEDSNLAKTITILDDVALHSLKPARESNAHQKQDVSKLSEAVTIGTDQLLQEKDTSRSTEATHNICDSGVSSHPKSECFKEKGFSLPTQEASCEKTFQQSDKLENPKNELLHHAPSPTPCKPEDSQKDLIEKEFISNSVSPKRPLIEKETMSTFQEKGVAAIPQLQQDNIIESVNKEPQEILHEEGLSSKNQKGVENVEEDHPLTLQVSENVLLKDDRKFEISPVNISQNLDKKCDQEPVDTSLEVGEVPMDAEKFQRNIIEVKVVDDAQVPDSETSNVINLQPNENVFQNDVTEHETADHSKVQVLDKVVLPSSFEEIKHCQNFCDDIKHSSSEEIKSKQETEAENQSLQEQPSILQNVHEEVAQSMNNIEDGSVDTSLEDAQSFINVEDTTKKTLSIQNEVEGCPDSKKVTFYQEESLNESKGVNLQIGLQSSDDNFRNTEVKFKHTLKELPDSNIDNQGLMHTTVETTLHVAHLLCNQEVLQEEAKVQKVTNEESVSQPTTIQESIVELVNSPEGKPVKNMYKESCNELNEKETSSNEIVESNIVSKDMAMPSRQEGAEDLDKEKELEHSTSGQTCEDMPSLLETSMCENTKESMPKLLENQQVPVINDFKVSIHAEVLEKDGPDNFTFLEMAPISETVDVPAFDENKVLGLPVMESTQQVTCCVEDFEKETTKEHASPKPQTETIFGKDKSVGTQTLHQQPGELIQNLPNQTAEQLDDNNFPQAHIEEEIDGPESSSAPVILEEKVTVKCSVEDHPGHLLIKSDVAIEEISTIKNVIVETPQNPNADVPTNKSLQVLDSSCDSANSELLLKKMQEENVALKDKEDSEVEDPGHSIIISDVAIEEASTIKNIIVETPQNPNAEVPVNKSVQVLDYSCNSDNSELLLKKMQEENIPLKDKEDGEVEDPGHSIIISDVAIEEASTIKNIIVETPQNPNAEVPVNKSVQVLDYSCNSDNSELLLKKTTAEHLPLKDKEDGEVEDPGQSIIISDVAIEEASTIKNIIVETPQNPNAEVPVNKSVQVLDYSCDSDNSELLLKKTTAEHFPLKHKEDGEVEDPGHLLIMSDVAIVEVSTITDMIVETPQNSNAEVPTNKSLQVLKLSCDSGNSENLLTKTIEENIPLKDKEDGEVLNHADNSKEVTFDEISQQVPSNESTKFVNLPDVGVFGKVTNEESPPSGLSKPLPASIDDEESTPDQVTEAKEIILMEGDDLSPQPFISQDTERDEKNALQLGPGTNICLPISQRTTSQDLQEAPKPHTPSVENLIEENVMGDQVILEGNEENRSVGEPVAESNLSGAEIESAFVADEPNVPCLPVKTKDDISLSASSTLPVIESRKIAKNKSKVKKERVLKGRSQKALSSTVALSKDLKYEEYTPSQIPEPQFTIPQNQQSLEANITEKLSHKSKVSTNNTIKKTLRGCKSVKPKQKRNKGVFVSRKRTKKSMVLKMSEESLSDLESIAANVSNSHVKVIPIDNEKVSALQCTPIDRTNAVSIETVIETANKCPPNEYSLTSQDSFKAEEDMAKSEQLHIKQTLNDDIHFTGRVEPFYSIQPNSVMQPTQVDDGSSKSFMEFLGGGTSQTVKIQSPKSNCDDSNLKILSMVAASIVDKNVKLPASRRSRKGQRRDTTRVTRSSAKTQRSLHSQFPESVMSNDDSCDSYDKLVINCDDTASEQESVDERKNRMVHPLTEKNLELPMKKLNDNPIQPEPVPDVKDYISQHTNISYVGNSSPSNSEERNMVRTKGELKVYTEPRLRSKSCDVKASDPVPIQRRSSDDLPYNICNILRESTLSDDLKSPKLKTRWEAQNIAETSSRIKEAPKLKVETNVVTSLENSELTVSISQHESELVDKKIESQRKAKTNKSKKSKSEEHIEKTAKGSRRSSRDKKQIDLKTKKTPLNPVKNVNKDDSGQETKKKNDDIRTRPKTRSGKYEGPYVFEEDEETQSEETDTLEGDPNKHNKKIRDKKRGRSKIKEESKVSKIKDDKEICKQIEFDCSDNEVPQKMCKTSNEAIEYTKTNSSKKESSDVKIKKGKDRTSRSRSRSKTEKNIKDKHLIDKTSNASVSKVDKVKVVEKPENNRSESPVKCVDEVNEKVNDTILEEEKRGKKLKTAEISVVKMELHENLGDDVKEGKISHIKNKEDQTEILGRDKVEKKISVEMKAKKPKHENLGEDQTEILSRENVEKKISVEMKAKKTKLENLGDDVKESKISHIKNEDQTEILSRDKVEKKISVEMKAKKPIHENLGDDVKEGKISHIKNKEGQTEILSMEKVEKKISVEMKAKKPKLENLGDDVKESKISHIKNTDQTEILTRDNVEKKISVEMKAKKTKLENLGDDVKESKISHIKNEDQTEILSRDKVEKKISVEMKAKKPKHENLGDDVKEGKISHIKNKEDQTEMLSMEKVDKKISVEMKVKKPKLENLGDDQTEILSREKVEKKISVEIKAKKPNHSKNTEVKEKECDEKSIETEILVNIEDHKKISTAENKAKKHSHKKTLDVDEKATTCKNNESLGESLVEKQDKTIMIVEKEAEKLCNKKNKEVEDKKCRKKKLEPEISNKIGLEGKTSLSENETDQQCNKETIQNEAKQNVNEKEKTSLVENNEETYNNKKAMELKQNQCNDGTIDKEIEKKVDEEKTQKVDTRTKCKSDKLDSETNLLTNLKEEKQNVSTVTEKQTKVDVKNDDEKSTNKLQEKKKCKGNITNMDELYENTPKDNICHLEKNEKPEEFVTKSKKDEVEKLDKNKCQVKETNTLETTKIESRQLEKKEEKHSKQKCKSHKKTEDVDDKEPKSKKEIEKNNKEKEKNKKSDSSKKCKEKVLGERKEKSKEKSEPPGKHEKNIVEENKEQGTEDAKITTESNDHNETGLGEEEETVKDFSRQFNEIYKYARNSIKKNEELLTQHRDLCIEKKSLDSEITEKCSELKMTEKVKQKNSSSEKNLTEVTQKNFESFMKDLIKERKITQCKKTLEEENASSKGSSDGKKHELDDIITDDKNKNKALQQTVERMKSRLDQKRQLQEAIDKEKKKRKIACSETSAVGDIITASLINDGKKTSHESQSGVRSGDISSSSTDTILPTRRRRKLKLNKYKVEGRQNSKKNDILAFVFYHKKGNRRPTMRRRLWRHPFVEDHELAHKNKEPRGSAHRITINEIVDKLRLRNEPKKEDTRKEDAPKVIVQRIPQSDDVFPDFIGIDGVLPVGAADPNLPESSKADDHKIGRYSIKPTSNIGLLGGPFLSAQVTAKSTENLVPAKLESSREGCDDSPVEVMLNLPEHTEQYLVGNGPPSQENPNDFPLTDQFFGFDHSIQDVCLIEPNGDNIPLQNICKEETVDFFTDQRLEEIAEQEITNQVITDQEIPDQYMSIGTMTELLLTVNGETSNCISESDSNYIGEPNLNYIGDPGTEYVTRPNEVCSTDYMGRANFIDPNTNSNNDPQNKFDFELWMSQQNLFKNQDAPIVQDNNSNNASTFSDTLKQPPIINQPDITGTSTSPTEKPKRKGRKSSDYPPMKRKPVDETKSSSSKTTACNELIFTRYPRTRVCAPKKQEESTKSASNNSDTSNSEQATTTTNNRPKAIEKKVEDTLLLPTPPIVDQTKTKTKSPRKQDTPTKSEDMTVVSITPEDIATVDKEPATKNKEDSWLPTTDKTVDKEPATKNKEDSWLPTTDKTVEKSPFTNESSGRSSNVASVLTGNRTKIWNPIGTPPRKKRKYSEQDPPSESPNKYHPDQARPETPPKKQRRPSINIRDDIFENSSRDSRKSSAPTSSFYEPPSTLSGRRTSMSPIHMNPFSDDRRTAPSTSNYGSSPSANNRRTSISPTHMNSLFDQVRNSDPNNVPLPRNPYGNYKVDSRDSRPRQRRRSNDEPDRKNRQTYKPETRRRYHQVVDPQEVSESFRKKTSGFRESNFRQESSRRPRNVYDTEQLHQHALPAQALPQMSNSHPMSMPTLQQLRHTMPYERRHESPPRQMSMNPYSYSNGYPRHWQTQNYEGRPMSNIAEGNPRKEQQKQETIKKFWSWLEKGCQASNKKE